MAVLMTSKEVCDHLGIKVNNLYQLQVRGQLKAVRKEGKHCFFSQEDVQAFKAKRDAKGK